VRFLLDTNVLLWTIAGHARAEALRERLVDDDNDVYVSVVCYWEIAIKSGLGKLDVALPGLRRAVAQSGFLELPVLGAHAEEVARLPALHRDPFDRLLVAQAICEPLRLLTGDAALAAYGSAVEVV
jgi:PIN domain nuclease of toxin-antitoxin system